MRLENGNRQTQELVEVKQRSQSHGGELERQETLRRRLTSDVAHELRTPVANVS